MPVPIEVNSCGHREDKHIAEKNGDLSREASMLEHFNVHDKMNPLSVEMNNTYNIAI